MGFYISGHGEEVSGFKAYTGAYSGSITLKYKVTEDEDWQNYANSAEVSFTKHDDDDYDDDNDEQFIH